MDRSTRPSAASALLTDRDVHLDHDTCDPSYADECCKPVDDES